MGEFPSGIIGQWRVGQPDESKGTLRCIGILQTLGKDGTQKCQATHHWGEELRSLEGAKSLHSLCCIALLQQSQGVLQSLLIGYGSTPRTAQQA
jgi:hypothetical protein